MPKRQRTLKQFNLGKAVVRIDWHHSRRNGFFFTRSAKDGLIYETFIGLHRMHTGEPDEDAWVLVLGPLTITAGWITKNSNKRDLLCRNPDLK